MPTGRTARRRVKTAEQNAEKQNAENQNEEQQKDSDGQKGQNDQKQGDENKDGKAQGKKQPADKTQEEQKGENGGGRKEPGEQKQSQEAKKAARGDRKQAARQQQPEAQRENSRPPSSSSNSSGSAITKLLQSLAPLFKWIVYGVLALVGLFVVIRYWSRLREILAQLWAELMSLFGFGREDERKKAAQQGVPAPVEVRFAAFENPFFSGAAQRMSPAQLVRYTFEALEAWAREQVVARPPDQTPLEFARELGQRVPAIAKEVTATAELYVRVAYASKNPSRESADVLERLWRRMGMGPGA